MNPAPAFAAIDLPVSVFISGCSVSSPGPNYIPSMFSSSSSNTSSCSCMGCTYLFERPVFVVFIVTLATIYITLICHYTGRNDYTSRHLVAIFVMNYAVIISRIIMVVFFVDKLTPSISIIIMSMSSSGSAMISPAIHSNIESISMSDCPCCVVSCSTLRITPSLIGSSTHLLP